MAARSSSALAVKNACDHNVGIMDGYFSWQTSEIVSSSARIVAGRERDQIDLIDRTAFPAQREVGCGLVALDLYADLFKQRP
jgi:hypothetical protein